MLNDKELCQWLRDNSSGVYRNSEIAAHRIEELLESMERPKESFTTHERFLKRIKRLKKMETKLEAKHVGNEEKFTYHGGFDLGYIKGQISILEDTEELLESLERYKESFITNDGVQVVPGDKVWVISSTAEIKDSRVIKGSTSFMSCNQLVPVKNAFSSEDAAKDYLKEVGG